MGQAIGLAGGPLVILVGGLIGSELAPTPTLTTLPIATLVVGSAVGALPAAFWMRRVGRRLGFITGAFVGLIAAALGANALARADFISFCVATSLVGVHNAFVQQYRFAAAESVDAAATGRAVSIVLLGGVVAGLLGPEIARRTRDWLSVEYAASFIVLGTAWLVLILLLLFLDEPPPPATTTADDEPRPLRVIAAQPAFLLAVAAAVVAYAVMSFLMTATPISMRVVDGHSLDATALVIQAHVVAMYTPSLFTGVLVDRLGPRAMMGIGALLMLACVLAMPTSHDVPIYMVGLVLLGAGWNFLFLGGTVLLTRTYHPGERFRAQAMNDSLVFGVQAAASLSAGAALAGLGWNAINRIALLPLLLIAFLSLLLRTPAAPAPAPAGD